MCLRVKNNKRTFPFLSSSFVFSSKQFFCPRRREQANNKKISVIWFDKRGARSRSRRMTRTTTFEGKMLEVPPTFGKRGIVVVSVGGMGRIDSATIPVEVKTRKNVCFSKAREKIKRLKQAAWGHCVERDGRALLGMKGFRCCLISFSSD